MQGDPEDDLPARGRHRVVDRLLQDEIRGEDAHFDGGRVVVGDGVEFVRGDDRRVGQRLPCGPLPHARVDLQQRDAQGAQGVDAPDARDRIVAADVDRVGDVFQPRGQRARHQHVGGGVGPQVLGTDAEGDGLPHLGERIVDVTAEAEIRRPRDHHGRRGRVVRRIGIVVGVAFDGGLADDLAPCAAVPDPGRDLQHGRAARLELRHLPGPRARIEAAVVRRVGEVLEFQRQPVVHEGGGHAVRARVGQRHRERDVIADQGRVPIRLVGHGQVVHDADGGPVVVLAAFVHVLVAADLEAVRLQALDPVG